MKSFIGRIARQRLDSNVKTERSVASIKLEISRWQTSNQMFEAIKFQSMKREATEPYESFFNRLTNQAYKCPFEGKDRINQQLIWG
ncbi:hypothetical protein A3Q56_02541, partial [Intoshia linei]